MARKQEEAAAGSPAWMATFSDLMNLLLCFFVLLFSMSTVDTQKFQELAASLAASFSVLPSGGSSLTDDGILIGSGASQLTELSQYYNNMGLNTDGEINEDKQNASGIDVNNPDGSGAGATSTATTKAQESTVSAIEQVKQEGLEESERMAENIEKKLAQANVADQVEITATSDYVLLTMNGAILFDSGKAELKDEAVTLIDKVSDAVKQYDDNTILIEGHTDNVPINTPLYPNNMMLSLYRAYSVFNYFVSNKGFNEKSISSSGRGDAVPVASNDTADGRALNRRVEIKIYNSLNNR